MEEDDSYPSVTRQKVVSRFDEVYPLGVINFIIREKSKWIARKMIPKAPKGWSNKVKIFFISKAPFVLWCNPVPKPLKVHSKDILVTQSSDEKKLWHDDKRWDR